MARRLQKICSLLVASVFLLPAAITRADDGKVLFEKQCASCHTIGGGEGGGPDLKGVAGKRNEAWLIRVIVEPEKLTADKDAVQEGLVKKYGYEMPNVGVSREDAKKIIGYLKKNGGGGDAQVKTVEPAVKEGTGGPAKDATAAVAEEALPVKPAETALTPELIASGRALFIGEKKFTQRGAPCSSCHAFGYPHVASGNLAADLSGMYDNMGEQGLRGVLKTLKFPTMKKIYADKPLTDEEITAVIAFAKDASSKKALASGGSFPLAGIGLFIGAIVFLTLYKRRIG